VAEYGGVTMNHVGGLEIVAVFFVLAALAIIVTSGIAATMVAAWGVIAMILKALFYVPWGILLIGIGVVIIWQWGGLLGWLIGGWLVYTGGNCLFGSLAGFVTVPSCSDTTDGATTATRAQLRRAGLLKR
jgi:hypothetical protein